MKNYCSLFIQEEWIHTLHIVFERKISRAKSEKNPRVLDPPKILKEVYLLYQFNTSSLPHTMLFIPTNTVEIINHF